MKRKQLAALPVREVKQQLRCMTAAREGNVLLLDVFEDRKRTARYLLDCVSGEHCAYLCGSGLWHRWSLSSVVGVDPRIYGVYTMAEKLRIATFGDAKTVAQALGVRLRRSANRGDRERQLLSEILTLESAYNEYKREEGRERYMQRLRTLVMSVPEPPADFDRWIREAVFPEEYALKGTKPGLAYCTACSREIQRNDLKLDSGRMAKNGETARCPECGREVIVKPRSRSMERDGMVTLLQDIDEKKSIARHIDVKRCWKAEGGKLCRTDAVWLFLLRKDPRHDIKILYNQDPRSDWRRYGCFNKGNPANRRCREGYLYPEGIREALAGTVYSAVERLFLQMAAAGSLANYNRIMTAAGSKSTLRLIEYLFKGRFRRLLQETTERIWYYTGRYEWGPLDQNGKTIEEVFRIEDRQRINRIREMDGGEDCVRWMQLSDERGEKIPQETLDWLICNKVDAGYVRKLLPRMSPVKIKNYVTRQQAESYPGKSVRAVMEQWSDYLDMCRKEKKDISDEMVFRPKELKRRHDEIVEEINRRRIMKEMKHNREQAKKRAEELRARFPGAEEVLGEVKDRFEYKNENFMLLVPETLADITMEGAALHHCVGSTDRYFERIRNHETYICFLRRREEPETPYYTIEIEPGGTIRQHRGYLDEEPNINEVKPFLREYQRVLRKRLTEQDRRHAESSAVLRLKNIEELKAKNNRRVLNALMEDLMEAEVVPVQPAEAI